MDQSQLLTELDRVETIDHLTYASYASQRNRGITAERLKLIFENVEAMEYKYQENRGMEADEKKWAETHGTGCRRSWSGD